MLLRQQGMMGFGCKKKDIELNCCFKVVAVCFSFDLESDHPLCLITAHYTYLLFKVMFSQNTFGSIRHCQLQLHV